MAYLKRKENKKFAILKYIGLFLFMCGLFMFIYHHDNTKLLEDKDNAKIETFFKEKIVDNNVENTEENSPKKTTTSNKVDYNYIGVLEIPSISLKRGLVSPDSRYNNVNYNIQIIEHSTMPDVINGNLILASHNGASYISFFKNLHKLNINDMVYIYYQGYKYEYTLDNIYDTQKDGKVEIFRDPKKTALTLITCKKNTKDTQVVYVGYLTNKEQYS